MTQMNPAPFKALPWFGTAIGCGGLDGRRGWHSGEVYGMHGNLICRMQAKGRDKLQERMDHLVRAANCHDDMLEALKAAKAAFDDLYKQGGLAGLQTTDGKAIQCLSINEASSAINAAIAKAEGRS